MKTLHTNDIEQISGGRTTFSTVVGGAITWGIVGSILTGMTFQRSAMLGAGVNLVKMGAELADDYFFGPEIHNVRSV